MNTDLDGRLPTVEQKRRMTVCMGSGFGPADRPGMTMERVIG
jgi:hypothetical protein